MRTMRGFFPWIRLKSTIFIKAFTITDAFHNTNQIPKCCAQYLLHLSRNGDHSQIKWIEHVFFFFLILSNGRCFQIKAAIFQVAALKLPTNDHPVFFIQQFLDLNLRQERERRQILTKPGPPTALEHRMQEEVPDCGWRKRSREEAADCCRGIGH